jgi:hypothetical protein
MKRKQILIALGIITIAMPPMLGCGAAPQDQAPEVVEVAEVQVPETKEVDYLFVQSATSGSIADGVLTMGGISDGTICFSDRPERLAGHLTTEEFVAGWGLGDDSFAGNNPNATLSILTGPEPQEIVVVLSDPQLEDGALIYNVEILEGAAEVSGGACSLFIDVIGRPLTPVSVAGTTRRVARRTTRRNS